MLWNPHHYFQIFKKIFLKGFKKYQKEYATDYTLLSKAKISTTRALHKKFANICSRLKELSKKNALGAKRLQISDPLLTSVHPG